jgi:hypothetical protein
VRRRSLLFVLTLVLTLFCTTAPAWAAPDLSAHGVTIESWTAAYPGFTPYDQIKPALDDLVASSDRVRYEVMGKSAGGRDLYLVIVARPEVLADLDAQLDFAKLELSDPEAAQAQLAAAGSSVKLPVFINCSIHGNEPNGTDAGLRLIRRLATAGANDTEAQQILDQCIVLVNICQNPDGRVGDMRSNDNGYDLNRDFLLLTQPETKATAAQIHRWLPALLFDLHGYYNPMRIDPCTPPHNPNYEYDLFIKWALPTAYAARAAVTEHTNGNTAYPGEPGRHNVNIPYVDMQQGYEDYSPFYTPQFAMYYGAVALTMETFGENQLGTDSDFWACWAATLFGANHKAAMLTDQIEQFRRGVAGVQQSDILLPGAYVIPATAPLQRSPLEAARMVDYLCWSGAQVRRADVPFVLKIAGPNGNLMAMYPAGTYVVSLNQPLRDLVNTWLWDGEDVSYLTNAMYSTCATSLPQLLDFDHAIVAAPVGVVGSRVTGATWPAGGVAPGPATQYTLANDSNNAVRAANELLDQGATVKIATASAAGTPAGTFVVSAVTSSTLTAVAAAEHVTFTPATVAAPLKTLRPVKLAVYGSSDVRWIMDELGFHYTAIGATSSLTGYDAVLGNRTALSATNVKTYVRAGGGYVGVGYTGTSGPLGNMLPVTINVTNAYDNNAIVHARYRSDGLVGGYFRADDYAFVEQPIWFTSVKTGATVDAWYGDSPDWYVCGYWRDRAGARGKPAVVSGVYGAGKVAYIGFEPAFRGYPEGQYRLMANAIWYAMK